MARRFFCGSNVHFFIMWGFRPHTKTGPNQIPHRDRFRTVPGRLPGFQPDQVSDMLNLKFR